jgi:preprotein translocase subunit SecB
MDSTKQPGIVIGQVFLEKVVFSHRDDFLNLPPNTQPSIGDVAVGILVGEGTDGESGLVRIEVKTDPANKPIYNVELAVMALVKRTEGAGNMTIHEFLTSGASVSLLYPFVREALANLTLRGRFGPVFLNTINPQAIAEKLQAQPPAHAQVQTQPASGPVAGEPRSSVETAGPRKRKGPRTPKTPAGS